MKECRECNGKGKLLIPENHCLCPDCWGVKVIMFRDKEIPDLWNQKDCPRCDRKGYVRIESVPEELFDEDLLVSEVTCEWCFGTGYI